MTGRRVDPAKMSTSALAFIGDAVYEVYVRTKCVEEGRAVANRLHTASVRYVRASAQAQTIQAMLPSLPEEYRAVVKRGRNRKPKSLPKNADPLEYKWATAFEALVGYLYFTDRKDELDALANLAMAIIDGKDPGTCFPFPSSGLCKNENDADISASESGRQ
jgi:ribonuclease-3 family protein